MALPPVAWLNCDGLTEMAGLVLGALLASVTLVAVMVKLPLALKVTLNDFVPATRAAFAGRVAVESVEVIFTVSVTVLTRFQLASTAVTVTAKKVPEIWLVGVPVLPEALPGAAVSPGTSNCNFV